MNGEVPEYPETRGGVVFFPLGSGPPAMPTPDMPAATAAYYAPLDHESACTCAQRPRGPRRPPERA